MPGWRMPLVAAMALTLGLTPMQPVLAAPPSMPSGLASAGAKSVVVQVRRRGHRHHRHHHHGHGGGDLAIGLGIGIIGGLLAAEAYRAGPDYDDDVDPRELCARNFRSFEWDTGRYTTYSGERPLCPYLR